LVKEGYSMSKLADDNVDLMASNGLNASTGDYFFERQTVDEIAATALDEYDQIVRQNDGEKTTREHLSKDHIDELEWIHKRTTVGEEPFGPVAWVDSKKLNETGWGVIFPAGDDPRIRDTREALSELLDHRRTQVVGDDSEKAHYYREFIGAEGYQRGMTKVDFLDKYNATFSAADPENVPYYLLIVGDPNDIPFSFQYQLDVQYAVGRIYFDTLDEYARYARSVVMAESGQVKLPRRVSFFGVQNREDAATRLSATLLVSPLAQEIAAAQEKLAAGLPRWQVESFVQEETYKSKLLKLMGGEETPALLFTASHGAAFNKGDERQLRHQGALVCQDWPGPEEWGRSQPIPPGFYLSADDIDNDARLLGMIAFNFACFGAGTPEKDDFSYTTSKVIAPHSFLARLPQRLLGHEKGGALAVIGHVERAWDHSFRFGQGKKQTQTFRSVLHQLMDDYPIGAAMDFINMRYAELSASLTEYEHRARQGLTPNNYKLAGMWTANNDARSYVIIGDPAVRAVPNGTDVPNSTRPTIEPIVLTTSHIPPATPAAAAVGESQTNFPESGTDFSFLNLKETKDTVQESVREFVVRMKQTLSEAISDATSIEVLTYVSDDMSSVEYKGGQFAGAAELRAITRIKADGDTMVCVPRSGGRLDAELWQVHKDMVEQALTHRAEMIKTLSGALAGLIETLKLV
jgi:hypothetical protein